MYFVTKDMKVLFTAIFSFFFAFSSFTQTFPSEIWHLGEVKFEDGTNVSGALKYDLVRDAVQIKIGDRIETYSAQSILFFEFYQPALKIKRRFYSLPYVNDSGKKIPRFFEVAHEGKMTLLAREFIGTASNSAFRQNYSRRYSYYPAANNRIVSSRYLGYELFFLTDKGRIIEYSGKKKDLLHILKDKGAEIKDFIKKERIKVDHVKDVAKLTAHYNSLL